MNIRRIQEENIILCGFMGSGKSTVGRKLALFSKRQFIDLDRYIETEQNMSVKKIFDKKGEKAFREMEIKAVEVLAKRRKIVLALGGGTLLSPQNVHVLRRSGSIILLDTPLAAIQERLKTDKQRPLLQNGDRRRVINELYHKRLPKYRAVVDLIIPAGGPDSVVAKRVLAVLDALSRNP